MLPGSPEFVIADLACAAFGLVSVPLASDNDERISQLVESCDLGLIICLERTLDRLLGLKKGGRMITLRHVVIVGAAPRPPEIRKAGQVGILLYGFEDLVLRGYRSMMVAKPLSGDSHFSIVASTGDEEWAISNSNIICATHVIRDDVGVNLGPADCMFIQSRGSGLSRTAIWTAIGSGASIAFPSSDVEVFEELQGLKAAVLVADPDFLKRTVRTIRKSLKDDAERARFERTYQTVEQSGDISGSKSEELAPFRKILGGNIRSLLVPGPVDPESLNFWRVMLGVRAFVFYGSDGGGTSSFPFGRRYMG